MSSSDGTVPAASNKPEGCKRVMIILAGIIQMVVVALLGVTLSGIPAPTEPINPETSAIAASLNNFIWFSGDFAFTVTNNAVVVSIAISTLQYFRLANMGQVWSYSNSITGLGQVEMMGGNGWDVLTYKPCKHYNTTQYTFISSGGDNNRVNQSEELSNSPEGFVNMPNHEVVNLLKSSLETHFGVSTNPLPFVGNSSTPGNNTSSDDDNSGGGGGMSVKSLTDQFCSTYASDCASSGDAAAAGFAIAFVLAFVNIFITFMRLGSDDPWKPWTSIALHLFTVMFIAIALGSFSNGCSTPVINWVTKQLTDATTINGASIGTWTFNTFYGIIFDCGMAALVFCAIASIVTIIFRFMGGSSSAPMASAEQRETGIAAPAPKAPAANADANKV